MKKNNFLIFLENFATKSMKEGKALIKETQSV